MRRTISVIRLGASTPVGRDAWSTAAAVRAGISGFNAHPSFVDECGEPVNVAVAPWLDSGLDIDDRMCALLAASIDQVLPAAESGRSAPRLSLAIGLSEPRPGFGSAASRGVTAFVESRYRGLDVLRPSIDGHAAGLLTLQRAVAQIETRAADACVVAAVDSYIDWDTVEWLEASNQLHGAGELNNAWGFVPGEGAGAVLIASEEFARDAGWSTLAQLVAIGEGYEPSRIKTETVCTGAGLTAAWRSAIDALPAGSTISDVYCDMNGEPYRADEFGFASLRLGAAFRSVSDFVAPADCTGDIGAANGLLSLVLATVAGLKGYARGRTAFVSTSSENGRRAAAIVNTRTGPGVA